MMSHARRVFDYVPRFDERSWDYRMAAPAPAAEVEERVWPCPLWLDQGAEGACTGFSMAHALATAACPKVDVTEGHARLIYTEAQKVDQWPGEDYEGSSVLAAAKVAHREGFISSYSWAMGVDDVVHAISTTGPVVLGIPWLASMMTPRADGLLEVEPGPRPGGHAILARGFERRTFVGVGMVEVLVLRNSWGDSWGVGGDCFLALEDLEVLLDGGEACIPVGTPESRLTPEPADTAAV